MEKRNADRSHGDKITIMQILGSHSRHSLHIAIVGISDRESDRRQDSCPRHLQLLLLGGYLFVQQGQLRTQRNVVIQLLWHTYLNQGIGRFNLGIQLGTQDITQSKPTEVRTVTCFLQLVLDLASFGPDTQQLILRTHLGLNSQLHLIVQRIHLTFIRLQHPHLPLDRDQCPVGLVCICQYLLTRLVQLKLSTLFPDTGQFSSGQQTTTRIEWLGHIHSGHVHAMHL